MRPALRLALGTFGALGLGCSVLTDLDALASRPASANEDATVGSSTTDGGVEHAEGDAKADAEQVIVEDWTAAAPSSRWKGSPLESGVAGPDGLCVPLAVDRYSSAIELDTVIEAKRLLVRIDYSYTFGSEAVRADGVSAVGAGGVTIASARRWEAVTSAIADNTDARLVVESGGTYGTDTPVPRSVLAHPLRLESEMREDAVEARLYSRQSQDYLIDEKLTYTTSKDLYDVSQGIRPAITFSSFFGKQTVCIARVEVHALR
ncbi:MAG: hypothetical protein J0I07_23240 [Myxococcales bacterium]|nr:hypothetical protein [Myxococcales bacterium]